MSEPLLTWITPILSGKMCAVMVMYMVLVEIVEGGVQYFRDTIEPSVFRVQYVLYHVRIHSRRMKESQSESQKPR